MDTKKLRQKILDLAIHGKLVPQDPNDEPASVLLDRIRAEKEQLIREGKIKAPKKSKSAGDTSHYPKDVPFEVPEGWCWRYLSDIGTWQSGATPSRGVKAYFGGSIPWLKTGDLNDDYVKDIPERITDKALKETSVKLNPEGSVLIAMYGATIGKVGILTFPATTNQACCACSELCGVDNRFLFYFLISHKEEFIRQAGGGAQPNISKEIIVNTPIPIPPAEEQKRIVSEIEKWLSVLKDIDKSSLFIQAGITACKARILDLAIHGKLVPQGHSDEPALELLKRINPDFVPSDNLHYGDCPEGWTIATVADVFEINPKVQGFDEVDAGFVPMTNICDGFRNKFNFEVRKWAKIKNGFTRFANGDIAVAKISPCLENRKSAIMRNLPNGIGAGTTELNIFRSRAVNPEYGLLFFKSDDFINACAGSYNGVVGQQRVSRSLIEGMQFLLPPMEEQKRIVAAINGYFAVINDIESSLQ